MFASFLPISSLEKIINVSDSITFSSTTAEKVTFRQISETFLARRAWDGSRGIFRGLETGCGSGREGGMGLTWALAENVEQLVSNRDPVSCL